MRVCEVRLTDFEKRRLKKMQEASNAYQEAREAHGIEGVRLARMGNKVYADFEKFWAPIRKRENEPPK